MFDLTINRFINGITTIRTLTDTIRITNTIRASIAAIRLEDVIICKPDANRSRNIQFVTIPTLTNTIRIATTVLAVAATGYALAVLVQFKSVVAGLLQGGRGGNFIMI